MVFGLSQSLVRALTSAIMIMMIGLPLARAADHATVIMYHRFGESQLPSTNTTLEQFDAHLNELATGGYTVLPLSEITTKIIAGESLPDRAVAITVDDAFISFYQEAWPRLKAYNFPVTLFIATEAIDKKLKGYASWDQLRQLQAEGVEFGSQSNSHPHMHMIDLASARQEIEISNQRFVEELGIKPMYFAYPYGEYTPEIRDLMREMGFNAAFGQHSGVMHKTQNTPRDSAAQYL